MILGIYLIGVIIAFVGGVLMQRYADGEISYREISYALVASMFSWFAIIIFLVMILSDYLDEIKFWDKKL